ncbi:hypothetical protein ACXFAU_16655 [Paenibacillus glucanolyticus]|uniref:hypothetical protein n=1 Tax=Paenibacillus TaxID=44249 RepID=UPI0024737101|nr:hypothetical protein [Paenibacillus sp. LBL]MDH6670713.1 hypothetical protein [Paenibacillus sp. LBL]
MNTIKIEQAVITNVEQVHDYFQIVSTKFTLNIYNSFYVKYNNMTSNDYEMLVGKVIKTIELTEKEALVLELKDKIYICISLANEDYLGPEAVHIKFNTGEVIII